MFSVISVGFVNPSCDDPLRHLGHEIGEMKVRPANASLTARLRSDEIRRLNTYPEAPTRRAA